MSQNSSRPVSRNFSEGVLRVLFGVFLAVVAIVLAVLPRPEPFAAAIIVTALFGAREWHRMVRAPAQREIADLDTIHIQTAITCVAIAAAVIALMMRFAAPAFLLLSAGAVGAFVWAQKRSDNPLWHAGGVLYLGLPSLALVGLRTFPAHGEWYVLGLFLIVWATDTGALVFGKLIGGAKIAPKLSPGKTWAGTIGGSLCAALIFAAFIGLLGFDVTLAALYAFAFSVVAHGGDLFESLVKRRFGYKDSGGLIPGHGGVLDRMDSMFAASVVLALLVFGLQFNPLFGGRV